MRLHVLSDLHLESGPYRLPDDLACDVVIAAGDIGEGTTGVEFLRTLDRPVVYVPGNHEYYSRGAHADMADTLAAIRDAAAGTNVHVLDNNSVEIMGTRFLGATLWTSYGNAHPGLLREALASQNDYLRIGAQSWFHSLEQRKLLKEACDLLMGEGHWTKMLLRWRRFHPMIALALHGQSIDWLERHLAKPFDGPTVVVTHHHPLYRSLILAGTDPELIENQQLWYRRGLSDDLPRYRIASYASDLSDLLRRHRAAIDLWVSGHIHTHLDYVAHGARVVCNPRGLAVPLSGKASAISRSRSRVPGFDPEFVVDLNEGLRPAVELEIDAVRLQLKRLHSESAQFAEQVCQHEGIVQQAIREALATRTQKFASIFDRLIQSIAESIDCRPIFRDRRDAWLAELGLPGLTGPLLYEAVSIPALPYRRSEAESAAGCIACQQQCLDRLKALPARIDEYCRQGKPHRREWKAAPSEVIRQPVRPVPAKLVERLKRLTRDVEVDLDARLPPEDGEP